MTDLERQELRALLEASEMPKNVDAEYEVERSDSGLEVVVIVPMGDYNYEGPLDCYWHLDSQGTESDLVLVAWLLKHRYALLDIADAAGKRAQEEGAIEAEAQAIHDECGIDPEVKDLLMVAIGSRQTAKEMRADIRRQLVYARAREIRAEAYEAAARAATTETKTETNDLPPLGEA